MNLRWRPHDDEVIDHNLLRALGVLAHTNGRSVVQELNHAVCSYVEQHLPSKLGDDGFALLVEVMDEDAGVEGKLSSS